MSKYNATSRIVCISNGTTYTCILQCDQGDINQYYNDTGGIFPVFNGNNAPSLLFLAYNSEESAVPAVFTDGQVKWVVNGKELAFTNNVSATSFNGETGHFKRGTKDIQVGNKTYQVQTLTVIKNLVNINDKQSFAIIAYASQSVENTSFDLSAVFPVTIAKGEVNSKRVRIQSPTSFKGTPFQISKKYETDKNGTLVEGCYCKLEAVAITNDVNSAAAFAYYWYQQKDGNWSKLAETSSILTVTEPMVDGSALFKCLLKTKNSDGTETDFGMDIQNVNDVSDPYQVYPNCVNNFTDMKPAVAVSYKRSGVPIRYAPYIKQQGADKKIDASRCTFSVSLFNGVGTLLNGKNSGYNPPFLNTDKRSGSSAQFEIPEPFISDNNGVDVLFECDIADT